MRPGAARFTGAIKIRPTLTQKPQRPAETAWPHHVTRRKLFAPPDVVFKSGLGT
jgi:hypothetical protein